MLLPIQISVALSFASQSVLGFNFPFESIQLEDSDVANNTDIAFGALPAGDKIPCKTFPGDADWPSDERWNAFRDSLDGALIKGVPPAAACYKGQYEDSVKCAAVRRGQSQSNFVKEDPVLPFGQWQLDNPCPVPQGSAPVYTCNITSFPAYVVNASTVKHVQLAVNFARNNNIRLTIKNTGHDFLGRNTGGGALQLWVHHLKAWEYLPSTTIAEYSGRAARVGAALEQYQLHTYMQSANITVITPGSTTVGALGGFMQGGGFSYLSSKFGLMADQILSLEVVTADGRFVHADPTENTDLFWAIRGGGPSNYGVVTSAVIKAYDPISIAISDFTFSGGPIAGFPTDNKQVSAETFWKGVSAYFSHLPRINDARGIGWNNINSQASSRGRVFAFSGRVYVGGLSATEAKALVQPIIADLNALGINITNPEPSWFATFPASAIPANGPGEGVSNGRFVSRLFPRKNFEDAASAEFQATMASIRTFVDEGGYNFHSVDFHPSLATAGYPGRDSAVNPALRTAMMHATGFDTGSHGPETTAEQRIASHARLNTYAQKWRDASPGSGAYMNEADTEEPNFQQSFYGANYERLLGTKRKVDPWSVFYAVTAVGSEVWKVQGTRGLPTQQGRLCRV
ncbi:FAD/FMN-containing isoamyl alcohol oxidase-like protein MreA [Massariosphaeria phaeospora]|uniref:FAD/FMN-containing isoamyl alcohol oxidase-like protein MreA n=1 Tax=Massariosphaeria phaeospora TaxID=100035 RepID=A0A7C8IA02_9PLEO|nr:FAD/FMN-containing isoamyl alcohol oxidase-like protein MreA [Massariosphaeria phaeospora]